MFSFLCNFAFKIIYTMEETKKQRGGRRAGAGRKAGSTKTLMSLLMDNDLLAAFKANENVIKNRSQYINKAIRQALIKDNLLKISK